MNTFLRNCLQKVLHLSPDLVHSRLYDDTTFYHEFMSDLKHCKKEVIIESPFITTQRMSSFIPVFESLVKRKVKVYVVTRDPNDHDLNLKQQAESEIRWLESIGVQVIISTDHNHRKLAMLDRKVLWEGSLNILSQNHSKEIMRRIENGDQSNQMFKFVGLGNYIY